MDQITTHWFKQLHQLWHKVTRTMIGMVVNITLPREMGQLRPHLVTWEGFWCPHKLYNGCLLIKVLMPCFTLQWAAPNETFYWSLISFSFHPKSVRIDLPYQLFVCLLTNMTKYSGSNIINTKLIGGLAWVVMTGRN